MPDIKKLFTEKLGPLPAWAWAAIGIGGVLIYEKMRGGSSSSSTSNPAVTPLTVASGPGSFPTSDTTTGQPVSDNGTLAAIQAYLASLIPQSTGTTTPPTVQTTPNPPSQQTNTPYSPPPTPVAPISIAPLPPPAPPPTPIAPISTAPFQPVASPNINQNNSVFSPQFGQMVSTLPTIFAPQGSPLPPGAIAPLNCPPGFTLQGVACVPIGGGSAGYNGGGGFIGSGLNTPRQLLPNNLLNQPQQQNGYIQNLVNQGIYTRLNPNQPVTTNQLGVSGQYINGVWTPVA